MLLDRRARRTRLYSIEEGDTDKAPYSGGTWGSRSTPVSGIPKPENLRRDL